MAGRSGCHPTSHTPTSKPRVWDPVPRAKGQGISANWRPPSREKEGRNEGTRWANASEIGLNLGQKLRGCPSSAGNYSFFVKIHRKLFFSPPPWPFKWLKSLENDIGSPLILPFLAPEASVSQAAEKWQPQVSSGKIASLHPALVPRATLQWHWEGSRKLARGGRLPSDFYLS